MRGFRIGSVFGIDIRIDASWFLIFFLILWSLTVGVFPVSQPGLSPAVYLAMGIVGTLLFFVSLLGHELSHSLVARSKGIPVEGITLFIFGGMAHTRMEFEEPKDELLIAGAGPLSSLLIAGLFGLLAWGGAAAGMDPAITGVAAWLALINVVLAVFNLLPGFPLDGGRLLRAGVWKATGDLTRATRTAAAGGRWLGYGLMAIGVLQIFAANLIGGLWMVFIGWFVRTAAESSYAQHLLRRSLEGIRALDAMSPDPQTVSPALTLREFVEAHVLHGRHQGYPVAENGEAVGIITLARVKQVPREQWTERTVREMMVPADGRTVVRPEDSMLDVLDKLNSSPVGRVLVTGEGRLQGIITRSDLARWIQGTELLQGSR